MKIKPADILILHGKSLKLVNELKSLFQGLGISAGTVLDQPSGRRAQHSRVETLIRKCGLPLVLATFDEDTQNARTPRSNVLHELTLCSEIRAKDTLVLQEERNGVKVDLGSNFDGRLVAILFDKGKVYQTYPDLLKELRQRGFFSSQSSEKKKNPRHEANAGVADLPILIEFMKNMDSLWKHFDLAWKRLPWGDYGTLHRYADNIDYFFVCYWNVIAAFAKIKHSKVKPVPHGLRAFARAEYEASFHWLEPVWHDIVYALMARVSDLKNARKSQVSLLVSFQEAEQKLSGIRKNAKIESRVRAYIQIGEALHAVMKKLEASPGRRPS